MKIAVLKEARGRGALRGHSRDRQEIHRRWAPKSRSRPARAKARRSPTPSLRRRARRSVRAPRCSSGAGIMLASTGRIRRRLKGRSKGRCSSAASIRFAGARRSTPMPRRDWKGWRWNGCRGSRARSPWTFCPRSPTSRATKRSIEAAAAYGRAFPMMMTAAGTISPAKVFVMGVGVAGLQAIATAKRLGAQVSATDVRSATKEQIQSLGAKPIFVENVAGIEGEGAGGYATEMSDGISEGAGRAGLRPYRQAGHRHHHRADPRAARAAPDQRRADRHDAAGQRDRRSRCRRRRQCRGHRRGRARREAWRDDHRRRNLARSLAADASALFARNLYNFLSAFWDKEQGRPVLPDDDEIVKAIRLTQGGKVVNERLTAA